MSEAGRKPKVTLEDLLQIKRSERPAAEFWPQFEQELRAKQLAALVQPVKPWWQGLLGRKLLVRVYAPLGAAAVVAFSLGLQQRPIAQPVVMAHQQEPVVASSVASAPVIGTDVVVATPSRAGDPLESSVAAPATLRLASAQEKTAEADAESIVITKDPSLASAEQLLQAGTATVKAAGQALAQAVGLVGDDTAKVDAGLPAMAEPLAQLSTPRDSRRARLLAYSVAYDPHAASSQDSARSRDRIARRISDESVYDSISRLGVSGDRVSIKF